MKKMKKLSKMNARKIVTYSLLTLIAAIILYLGFIYAKSTFGGADQVRDGRAVMNPNEKSW
ncbi:MAG: hypothetical protein KA155_07645 [Alphaproteobacteria bacterium]|jgi:hypothetical protein|nr:hypothetical protein [Alphaproteobacteria bacterium]